MIKLFILLTFLALLAGCMVGPNFKKPEMEIPTAYIEVSNEKTVAISDQELIHWWGVFEDPFLNKLLQDTLDGNFDLQLALEKVLQVRAQYRIQNAKLFPEIDLEASVQRSRISQTLFDSTVLGPPIQNLFQIGFDAIWEIDFFGKLRRAKRAAYFTWEATKEDARNVQITVLSEVASHYVRICALQKRSDISVMQVKLDEELLALTKERFESGLASEREVEERIALLEEDRASLQLLELFLRQTIYSMSVLLGKPPETLIEEFEKSHSIPYSRGKVPAGLPSELLRRRPDIRSAERQIAAATEQIGVAVADLFPQVALTGSNYGYQSTSLSKFLTLPSRTWSIAPILTLPLIDFGKRKAAIAVQTAIQRQALISYEKTVISALEEVENALVAYFKEEDREKFLSEQVKADKRTFTLISDLFESGLVNYNEALEVQKKLLSSENTLVESRQAVTTNLIALYKALGGEWECSYSQ